MKYTTIIATLSLGLTALVSTGCVVDAAYAPGGGYSSSSYDTGSDFREKVRRLRDHYARVHDEAAASGAHHHIWRHLAEINDGIDRVASFVFSGQFVPERAQENISRLHAELREVSEEIHQ